MPIRFFTLLLAGAGSLCCVCAQATDLTLAAAVTRALSGSAVLRSEDAANRAIRSQADLDALSPPMTIGLELENVAGTGDLSGAGAAESTLRLGRVLELGPKPAARAGIGDARVARQQHHAELRRLDLSLTVAKRFIEVVARQAELELAERNLEIAASTREAIARRVAVAGSSDADLQLADLAIARTELEREDAEHELASARVALSVLWGAEQPDFDRAAGRIDELPSVEPFAVLAARLPRGPEQHAYALEAREVEAQGRLASAMARPDLHTSVGVRRLEALDDQAFLLSVTMPLGNAGRSSLASASLRAEAERIEADRAAAGLEAYQQLFDHYQALQHARQVVTTVRDRMLPRAREALSATSKAYDDARASFLQVAQMQSLLLDLQREAIEAASRYHRLLADIERATATSEGDIAP